MNKYELLNEIDSMVEENVRLKNEITRLKETPKYTTLEEKLISYGKEALIRSVYPHTPYDKNNELRSYEAWILYGMVSSPFSLSREEVLLVIGDSLRKTYDKLVAEGPKVEEPKVEE